ncbi:MAG: DUF4998 domain-containing protein [Rikenellaceae bacterium]
MKQFFKPTAILACLALLFGAACSDDGTEDASVSVVEESEIRVVYPGENQAWIKWVVPDDSNVSSCQISWTNSDGNSSGAASYETVEGWMEYTIQNVPASTYTFTLRNYTKSGATSNVSTYEVDIYDETTYAGIYPGVVSTYADSNGSTITWGDSPADCIGVIITYVDTDGNYQTTGLTSIEEPTLLTNVKNNSYFTFVTCYCPSFIYLEQLCSGLDVISIPSTTDEDQLEAQRFPDASPVSPSDVTVYPGDEKLKLTWYVPQVVEISSSIISYAKGDEEPTIITLSNADGLVKGGFNEIIIGTSEASVLVGYKDADLLSSIETRQDAEMTSGEYTISVYNQKGLTETNSEAVVVSTYVYDDNTYNVPPTIKELAYDGSDATVIWNSSYTDSESNVLTVEDCIGVKATYRESEKNEADSLTTGLTSIDEILYMTSIYYEDGNVGASTFSYTTYYCPERGLDTMSIYNNDPATNIVPIQSPKKPINVEMYPGDNKILLMWDLENDSFIEGVRISYTDQDGNTQSEEFTSLNIGSENMYYITNVSSGSTYSVSIQTINTTNNVSSAEETVDNLEVYDFASFEASCVAPTIGTSEFNTETCEFTIVWDAPVSGGEIDFTYVCDVNGTTKNIVIKDYEDEMVFTDLMPGTEYTYEASFTPVPNALDVLRFSAITSVLPDALVYKGVMAEYHLNGDFYCNSAAANGDSGHGDFYKLYNGTYWKSTSTSCYEYGAANPVVSDDYPADVNRDVDQTITIDLGKAYSLSQFSFHYYCPGLFTSGNISQFSLWGTAADDPMGDETYLNAFSGDGVTPDLTYWTCLIPKTEIMQPSENNIDFNGDGTVDTDDDYDYVWAGAVSDVPDGTGNVFTVEDSTPIRYVRIQVHATWGGGDTSGSAGFVRIQELDFWQKGFVPGSEDSDE